MKASFLVLLILGGCVDGTSANSARCGKITRQIEYGHEKLLQVPHSSSKSCRYRIRGPRGLHIKLVFHDHNTKFKVYNASGESFDWSDNHVISRSRTKLPIESEVEYKISTLGIRIYTGDYGSNTSFSYSVVIPEDGLCGYNTVATKTEQAIVSPGYPRLKSPKDLRCVWTIRSNPGEQIFLRIKRFKTASKDFMQMFDGRMKLGYFSGKYVMKYSTLHYTAYSGQAQISFFTNTSRSKGFRLTYKAIKVVDLPAPINGTEEKIITQESDDSLRCHSRKKTMLDGRLFWEDHYQTVCSPDTKCGIATVKASNGGFGYSTVAAEYGLCVPSAQCKEDPCDFISKNENLKVTFCAGFCCSTDLCNRLPDWEISPPPQGLRCHKESRETNADGRSSVSHESTDRPCVSGTVCGLFIYQGNTTNYEDQVVEVSGYDAKCVYEAACNKKACGHDFKARNVNITSCNVFCCSSDECNDPPESYPTPVPPDAVSECYNIFQSYSKYEVFSNFTKTEECYDFNSRCFRMDKVQVDRDGTEFTTTEGKCMTKETCKWEDECNSSTARLELMTVKSCQMSCCDTDLCNAVPPATAEKGQASNTPS